MHIARCYILRRHSELRSSCLGTVDGQIMFKLLFRSSRKSMSKTIDRKPLLSAANHGFVIVRKLRYLFWEIDISAGNTQTRDQPTQPKIIFHCLMVFKARVKLRSCHLSPHPKGSAFNVDWSDLTLRNIVSGCKELLFGLGRWLT